MWIADIYCDLDWVAACRGTLGSPRFRLSGPRSRKFGFAIEFLFFGDEGSVRHVRALLHTDSKDDADRCVDLNIQSWVSAIEVAVMLETGRPFHVAHYPRPQQFGVVMAAGSEDVLAAVITPAPP